MKIKNVKVYGLKESIIRSGYPKQTGEPENIELILQAEYCNISRAKKLSSAPIGSGHDNFLKGIVVQFDLQYPEYFSPQLQRYHWVDIISSQSKMHKLTSVKDIKSNCNKYVLPSQAQIINWLINEIYNNELITYPFEFHDEYSSFSKSEPYIIESKEECFMYIISNLPMGYELWMGISTSYLQLKTIYFQRKNHKLSDWREFCQWIETLPMSHLITGKDNNE